MVKQHHNLPATQGGRAASFPVVRRGTPKPDGTTLVEIEINLSNAPAPEREYVARVAAVERDGAFVRLTFAQQQRPKGYRSMIIIVMTEDDGARFLSTCKEFLPNLLSHLQSIGVSPMPLEQFHEDPASTVEMFANAISASYTRREASMDFYRVPVSDLRRLVNTPSMAGLDLEPVVRVALSTELLASLIDEMKNLHLRVREEAAQ